LRLCEPVEYGMVVEPAGSIAATYDIEDEAAP
jgi:hypothetical protein